jgi:Anti-sigma factor NepR
MPTTARALTANPTVRERNAYNKWTMTGDDTERRVARALRICVGNEVRKMYGDVPNEPIPSKIADLLHRLD